MTAQQPPNSKRTGKRVGIGARPPANPHAEAWIRQGDADALGKGDLYTARLTLDITPAMRARPLANCAVPGTLRGTSPL